MTSRNRSDSSLSSQDDITRFCLASRNDDEQTVRALLKQNPGIQKSLRKGTTALHIAAQAGALKTVKAIVECDVEAAKVIDLLGYTPFARACERGHLTCMVFLHEVYKEAIHAVDLNKATPLHRAAANDYFEACKFLLSQGAHVNAIDKLNETPLFYSTRIGSKEVGELLISYGADVNILNHENANCLFYAVLAISEQFGDAKKVLAMLLKQKADPNVKNNLNQTPLALAIEQGAYEAVSILLAHGADPDQTSSAFGSHFNEVLTSGSQEMIKAFEKGLGHEKVTKRLCELSSKLEPYSIVGKYLVVVGLGRGFCVEATRPFLNIFGDVQHTIRFDADGKEKTMLLERGSNQGLPFYVVSDSLHPQPLLVQNDQD